MNNWLDQKEYPFQSNYLNINGHKLHYIDEGQGEVLLFVHGTPSWSFDFRKVIKKLSTTYRCIAIDHIGFGLSDKPAEYDYSVQNHSKVLKQFIIEKDLQLFTIVVHDFGGPIGMLVAEKYPERIKNIVILNSWLWSSAKEPEFIKLSRLLKSPLLPFLYLYLNFSARFLLPASFGNKKLPKSIQKQYTQVFKTKNDRKGTLAFARSLLKDQDWFEELWNNRFTINQKPTLFIWGMKDKFLHNGYLDKFESGFPNSRVVKLDGVGHFPQEEESNIVGNEILWFLQES